MEKAQLPPRTYSTELIVVERNLYLAPHPEDKSKIIAFAATDMILSPTLILNLKTMRRSNEKINIGRLVTKQYSYTVSRYRVEMGLPETTRSVMRGIHLFALRAAIKMEGVVEQKYEIELLFDVEDHPHAWEGRSLGNLLRILFHMYHYDCDKYEEGVMSESSYTPTEICSLSMLETGTLATTMEIIADLCVWNVDDHHVLPIEYREVVVAVLSVLILPTELAFEVLSCDSVFNWRWKRHTFWMMRMWREGPPGEIEIPSYRAPSSP